MLGSAVMAPVALMTAGTPDQRSRWLPPIAAGECRVGIAATELMSRHEDAGVEARDGRLYGKALMVIDSGFADCFLVAIGSVNAPDSAPQSLAIVSARASGLVRKPLTTIDRTRSFGELVFDGAEVEGWIGGPGGAAEANRRMLTAGRVALAADLLGASARAIELSVEYAGKREQFGRVIASFQAVKHMCAEMIAELEPARSLVWYAAHAFDESSSDGPASDDQPEEARLMAAHAKAHLAEIGRDIVRTATEVHGGIGFTEEQNLHYWFKRVGVDRQLLGTPDQLREEAARLQGWSAR
jgi:alkylation response protein AidB-like acyl-CoA dehydrogenase